MNISLPQGRTMRKFSFFKGKNGMIGEAAKYVLEEIRERYAAVPWKEMAGMRDKLTHEYFGVNLEVVWQTIKKRLPELKILLSEINKGFI